MVTAKIEGSFTDLTGEHPMSFLVGHSLKNGSPQKKADLYKKAKPRERKNLGSGE